MTSEEPWDRIAEYYRTTINFGDYRLTKNFEVYASRDGNIAWSVIRRDHIEHLNPQGTQGRPIMVNDIGQMLSQIAEFQLKKPPVDAETMVKHNTNLVAIIMKNIKAKKA